MLSVIVYGRNDQHGYHYHKRLTISINAIAQTLTDPYDEILFVDYNSPNDFPTLLESIQDTLTSHAKSLIKIFRVRPHHHALFTTQTHLPILEPIARNIALYRSSPHNKWILSTNPDMLFVPIHPDQSLTGIVSSLSDGFYALPRYELPEQYWELALNRMDPLYNLDWLRSQTSQLHLNTIVRMDNFLQFDNPGDFQLILRKDLMEMGGFNEQMLHGWHVDANLSKRASLFIPHLASLEKQLLGFHCNHTETRSTLHHPHSLQNSWNDFVNNKTITSHLSLQKGGLTSQDIEEIRLNNPKNHPHLKALTHLPQCPQKELTLHNHSYNHLTYSPYHIFSFLTDHLCHLSLNTKIGYIGHNQTTIQLLNQYLQTRSFQHPLLISNGSDKQILFDWIDQCRLFIFDFGFDEHSHIGDPILMSPSHYRELRSQLKPIMQAFLFLTCHQKLPPATKCIGIQVTHTDIHTLFKKHLLVRTNTLITGISYGYTYATKHKATTYGKSYKKQWVLSIHYWVVRYCFSYSDQIHKWISCLKMMKWLKKM